jgi:hypothetical protein
MKAQLPADHHRKIDDALAEPGMGIAVYSDGIDMMLCSYGVRGADMPGRYPASMWGTLSLMAYCPAVAADATMRSPLLSGRDEIPQIRLPPRPSSRTQFPTMGFNQVPAALAPLAETVQEDERRRLLPDNGRDFAMPPTANGTDTQAEGAGLLTGADWWAAHLRRR